MTVVGTRPEIIRLSMVIAELDKYCDHILVHTGQNYDYELNEIFFKELNIRKPDYFLDAAGNTAAETIGKVIISIDKLLSEVKPNVLLVLGDTNSCMAILPAKRRKIPTFHMEAGNRCFDMRVPEEINRRVVDHIADINLTYSSIARDYLIAEGIPPDRVIKTGSPMFEVLSYYKPRIYKSKILENMKLNQNNFFLISAHREENIETDKNFTKLIKIFNEVAEQYSFPVIVSTHPRTRKRIESTKIKFHSKVKLTKPFGFIDYCKLQISSKLVLSDSGTINEEASILNFPAINLREAHERPEGMEETATLMVGLELERVLQGIELLSYQNRGSKRDFNFVFDYSIQNVSKKVVRIIHSYYDYVMRNVWKVY